MPNDEQTIIKTIMQFHHNHEARILKLKEDLKKGRDLIDTNEYFEIVETQSLKSFHRAVVEYLKTKQEI